MEKNTQKFSFTEILVVRIFPKFDSRPRRSAQAGSFYPAEVDARHLPVTAGFPRSGGQPACCWPGRYLPLHFDVLDTVLLSFL